MTEEEIAQIEATWKTGFDEPWEAFGSAAGGTVLRSKTGYVIEEDLGTAREHVIALLAEVRRLRAPVQWSKEPPSEPGFYWSVVDRGAPLVQPVEVFERGGELHVYDGEGGADPLRVQPVKLWGARLEAPPAPSEENLNA